MSTQVDAMIEESGLDPFESDELAAFLAMLGSLVDDGAPTPSPALAKLLSGAAAGAGPISLAVRRHQNALAAAVLAVTGIVATGVAAAANDLPPTAQRIVADFSNRFLPFDFPYPGTRSENLTIDPDGDERPTVGADDGEAQTGVQDGGPEHSQSVVDPSDRDDFYDDSGASPESQSDDEESGTETDDSEGDDREDADSVGSDDSSSGESEDAAEGTTTGDGDGTVDTSGESDGDDVEPDDAEPEGDTPESAEAIDD